MKPLFQIALDNTSIEDAFNTLSKGVGQEVDIIEVGTLLLAAEGKKAIAYIKALYPHKVVVADFKMADAGKTMAAMFFDGGADYSTIICASDLKTMSLAHNEAKRRNKKMQIELYGPWNTDQAQKWYTTGIDHIIYHHSRDGEKEWTQQDIRKIKELVEIGYHVSITGGLKPEHIKMFAGLSIHAFIGGRSIGNSPQPIHVIREFKKEISKYW